MLEIEGIASGVGLPCIIELDDYIAIRFWSYPPSGPGSIIPTYFFIGNSAASLMELATNPEGPLVVRALTVVLFDRSHGRDLEYCEFTNVKRREGLPVLRKPEQPFEHGHPGLTIDLTHNFSLGMGREFFEIKFETYDAVHEIASFGEWNFCVARRSFLAFA